MNKYDYLKKNYKNSGNNDTNKFFKGLNELKNLTTDDVKYQYSKQKQVTTLLYNLRYALVILVVAISLAIVTIPIANKYYVKNQYKKVLFEELTYSYVDSTNFLFNEDDLINNIEIEENNR
ncbi:MAG: hypothetical protein A2086_09695 [Spirochaetes bacterium GWD1_27_9]|nr:MAG: hypothetical protein A2Z98_11935 [Spirochaetes bacterium GWB1_27_13]OHD20443.1 MAG: hypothetical protein A2Y34_02045 [Spirochaetes bacterium GWC1_27_15]OHD32017.1 MAG: hypothetical protein A2086_09695 [Spirochaetes bacterium GWD1_27_9]